MRSNISASGMTRPVFIVTLRPEPNTDPIRALRGALKVLGRRFGLRAIHICEQHPADALTDHQLKTVMAAAANIKPERRDVYLQRVEAMLKVRGIFDDSDVRDVAQLALCGLTTRKQTDAA
jgi:hypothetical protein